MKPEPKFLPPGDVVTLDIQGLGEQRQKVRAPGVFVLSRRQAAPGNRRKIDRRTLKTPALPGANLYLLLAEALGRQRPRNAIMRAAPESGTRIPAQNSQSTLRTA
jgi:hypothetical protein